MNPIALQSFNTEMKSNPVYIPNWKERISGLLRSAGSDPGGFFGRTVPGAAMGTFGLGIPATIGAMLASAMLRKKLPIRRSIKIVMPASVIGAGLGSLKGASDFYKTKGIELGINPSYSQEAIDKYIK